MIASGLRPGALRRAVPSAALALVATLLTGCSGDEGDAAPAPSTATSGTPSADPEPSRAESEEAEPSADPADDLPPVHSATSLPALMRERLTGGRITRVRQQAVTDAYTRWEVTYPSGDLTVSGVLLVPNGEGPFPGIVLNHGYIEPSIYVTGQGLAREQDWLARAGFVVLHTDYQGHAASDAATPLARETRLGYTRDTINAVQSLKRLPKVDPDRVAMLGRSMGGGVTYNALVAKPGLVRAAVVYAPVSSRFLDNLARWTIPERPEAAQALYDRFGTPRANPRFYRELSARTYFDRITEPELIHHGTSDDSCPIRWSRTTQDLLRQDGVRSRLVVYDGEEHAFVPRWEDSIRTTVAFLRRQLA